MRRGSQLLCLAIVLSLLATSAMPLAQASARARPPGPSERAYEHWEEGNWLIVETDVIGVALNKHKPFFAWWYVRENETVYIVHYKGLIEYLLWPRIPLVKPYSWAKELFERLSEGIKDYLGLVRDVGLLIRELHMEIMMLHIPVGDEELDEISSKIEELSEAMEELHAWALGTGDEELVEHLEAMNATLTEMAALVDELRENAWDHRALVELKAEAGELRREWHMAMHEVFEDWCEWVKERVREIREHMEEVRWEKLFHPPYFSFAEGNWTLIGPENITAPNGTTIGLWFAYELSDVHNPAFEFAEGSITIRCRMYFTPVVERADDLNYTVTRAELKQDVVIMGWRWNLDLLKELASEVGFEVPENTTTGLALRLELLAVNATYFMEALEELEEPMEFRDLVTTLRDEAEQVDEVVSGALGELDDAAEDAMEELGEDLSVDEARGLLQEMVFMVEHALAALEIHGELINGLKEKAEEAGYEFLARQAEVLRSLVEETKEFLLSLNATLQEALSAEDTATVMALLMGIRAEVEAYLVAFKTRIGSVIDALENELMMARERISSRSVLERVKIGGEELDVRPDETSLRERLLKKGVDLKDMFEIGFLTENATILGWFKFVNASLVHYPNCTTVVMPVKLAYMRAGRALHLFLIYGYFNGATLEHDPSIGLNVPEAEEEPEYEVEAPSGSEAEPGGVQPIAEWPPGGPIAYLLTPEQVAIIALGLIAITAVALVARRRKKTINFY